MPAVGGACSGQLEPKWVSMASITTINIRTFGLKRRPAKPTTWHLRRVIMPRRSITGRLVRGQVWRRHDGRRWLYKKFVDSGRVDDDDLTPPVGWVERSETHRSRRELG